MTNSVDSSRRRLLRLCGGAGIASVSGCLRLTQDDTDGSSGANGDDSGTTPESGSTPDFDIELTPTWSIDILLNIIAADGDFFSGYSQLTRIRPDGETVFTAQEFTDEYRLNMGSGWNNSLYADSSGVYVGARHDEGDQGARLYAFDPETGEQQWMTEEPADGRHSKIVATNRVGDLVIYASQSDGTGDEQEPIVRAVDIETGAQEWQFELAEGFVNSIHGYGGSLIVKATSDIHIYDLSTQERQRSLGRRAVFSRAIQRDDTLYIGDDTMLALSLPSGDEQWATETDLAVNTSPGISEEALFVGTEAGYVSAFDRETGDQLWEQRINGVIQHTPVVAAGLVWIASERGGLFAFTTQGGELAYRTEVGSNFSFAIQDGILVDSERDSAFEINR